MKLPEIQEFLNECSRSELTDNAFGDVEVFWMRNGVLVALGYFSPSHAMLCSSDVVEDSEVPQFELAGEEAKSLRYAGTLASSQSNNGGN